MSSQPPTKKKKKRTRLKGTAELKPCAGCEEMKDRFKDFKPRWAGCAQHKTKTGRRFHEPGCEDCAALVNGNIRQPRCIDCDKSRKKKKKKAKAEKKAEKKADPVQVKPQSEPDSKSEDVTPAPEPAPEPKPQPDFGEESDQPDVTSLSDFVSLLAESNGDFDEDE